MVAAGASRSSWPSTMSGSTALTRGRGAPELTSTWTTCSRRPVAMMAQAQARISMKAANGLRCSAVIIGNSPT